MMRSNFLTRIGGAYQRRAARWLGRRPFTIPVGRAIISFTFDDFPCSALNVGGAILENYRVAGTYFASLGISGQNSPSGKIFALSDLTKVIERGHELGCHTYAHCPAWATDTASFETSVRRNSQALREQIPEAVFRSLSYPISYPRPATKRSVGRHFCCCRGGGQTFNTDVVDLNYLSAFFLEQSSDNLNAVKRIVMSNQSAGGWLIFATHDITQHPTRFGCTPAFFEEVVRFATEAGAEILPVARAYDVLQKRADSRGTA